MGRKIRQIELNFSSLIFCRKTKNCKKAKNEKKHFGGTIVKCVRKCNLKNVKENE